MRRLRVNPERMRIAYDYARTKGTSRTRAHEFASFYEGVVLFHPWYRAARSLDDAWAVWFSTPLP